MVPDVLLKSDPVVVHVDFKFKLVVLRKVGLQFMATDVFLLKSSDESISINSVVSKRVVDPVLTLNHSQGELYFPAFGNGG